MKSTRILLSIALLASCSHMYSASSSSAAACSSSDGSAPSMWENVSVAGYVIGHDDKTQKPSAYALEEAERLKGLRSASTVEAHLKSFRALTKGDSPQLRHVRTLEHHVPAACVADAYFIPSGNACAQDFITALHTNLLRAVDKYDHPQLMKLVRKLHPKFDELTTEEQIECRREVSNSFAVYAHSNWGIYQDSAPRHADHKTYACYHWTNSEDDTWKPHMVRESARGWVLSMPDDITPEEHAAREALLEDIRTSETQLSDIVSDLRWIHALGVPTREEAPQLYEGRTTALPGISPEVQAYHEAGLHGKLTLHTWLENHRGRAPRWIRRNGTPSGLDKLPAGHHAQYHWEDETEDGRLKSAHRSYATAVSSEKFIKAFATIESELLAKVADLREAGKLSTVSAMETSDDKHIAALPTKRGAMIAELGLGPASAYYIQATVDAYKAEFPGTPTNVILNEIFGTEFVTKNKRTAATKLCAEVLRNVPDPSRVISYRPTSVKQFYETQQKLVAIKEAIAQEEDSDKQDALKATEEALLATLDTLVEENLKQAIKAVNTHVVPHQVHRDSSSKDTRLIELHKIMALLQYATNAQSEQTVAHDEEAAASSSSSCSASSSSAAPEAEVVPPKAKKTIKDKGKEKAEPSDWQQQRRSRRRRKHRNRHVKNTDT